MPRFIDIDGAVSATAAADARAAIGVSGSHLFNVRDYGAVGDGTTNDVTAIQAAIDAAVAAGGGQVYLPAGDYKVANLITLYENIDLCGDGSGSVIRPVYPGPLNRVIQMIASVEAQVKNISIRRLRLDRSDDNVQHGIYLNGVDNVLIDQVDFVGANTGGGCIAVSGIMTSTDLLSTNVRITNCVMRDSGNNFFIQAGHVDGFIMANNVAYDVDREVFGVEPEGASSSAKNVVIANNTIYGSAEITGSNTGLIIVTTSSGGSVSGVTITGNVMRQASPYTDPNVGINVLGATDVTITGNVVYQMGSTGILIGNTDYPVSGAVIQGNSVRDCCLNDSSSGIGLVKSSHCVVSGNYVYGANHTVGVSELTASTNNLITGNVLRDATPLSLLYTSGSVAFNNKTIDGDHSVTLGVDNTYQSDLIINRALASAGRNRIAMQTGGVSRWLIDCVGAESTGNAGSDFYFQARADDGSAIGNALTIARATQLVSTGAQLRVGTSIELGHASDTTLSRSAAGKLAVEGVDVVLTGGALGTPASGTLTNCTFPATVYPDTVFIPATATPSGSSAATTAEIATSARAFGVQRYPNTPAQNNYVEWKVNLAAGTYSIDLCHLTFSSYGILDVLVDAVSVGTVDGYSAGSANKLTTFAGITVATAGSHTIRFICETKNASSSNYSYAINGFTMTKTA